MKDWEKSRNNKPRPSSSSSPTIPTRNKRKDAGELGADYFFDKATEIAKLAETFAQLRKEARKEKPFSKTNLTARKKERRKHIVMTDQLEK